jgi:hypothetical protein
MKGENISIVIADICHREGIKYSSVNPEVYQLYKDARRLGEIFMQLKEINSDLLEISERHKLPDSVGQMLKDDISKLEQIDHDIVKLAHKIREEEKGRAI